MADIGTTIQMRSILPTESGTRLWRSEHIHHHTTAQHDPFHLSKSYKGQTRLCLDHHSLFELMCDHMTTTHGKMFYGTKEKQRLTAL